MHEYVFDPRDEDARREVLERLLRLLAGEPVEKEGRWQIRTVDGIVVAEGGKGRGGKKTQVVHTAECALVFGDDWPTLGELERLRGL